MNCDQLNMKWKSYESNFCTSLAEFRDNSDFFDVTLACENDQIQCHKIVLSACSPFFLHLLRSNPHPHPLLYLRGVTFQHLLSMLDFMYNGQVSVVQKDLASFMAIAAELKVKGLTQTQSSTDDQSRKIFPPVVKKMGKSKVSPPIPSSSNLDNSKGSLDQEYIFSSVNISTVVGSPPQNKQSSSVKADLPIILPPNTMHSSPPDVVFPQNPFSVPDLSKIISMANNQVFNHFSPPQSYQTDDENNSGVFKEGVEQIDDSEAEKIQFKEKCMSMIKKQEDGSYQCLQCGLSHGRRSQVMRHVEIHVPCSRHTCNICNRSFKNKNSLHSHRSMKHRMSKEGQVTNNNQTKTQLEMFVTVIKKEQETLNADHDHFNENVVTVTPDVYDLQCRESAPRMREKWVTAAEGGVGIEEVIASDGMVAQQEEFTSS